MRKKNRQVLIVGLIIFLLLVVTLGISYAFFSRVIKGTTENTIELGSITFKYTENDNLGNGISIIDAFPLSDSEGKQLSDGGKIFDFKVESTLSRSDLKYEVVAEPIESSNLPLDAIKFYLTDITNLEEVEINSSINSDGNVKTLDEYSDTLIENANGKTVYEETILRNTKGYLKKFRARMWISEDIDWSDDKYIGKSGAIKINVYANGNRDMASANPTNPQDTGIERVIANNKYLFTKVENEEYQYTLTVPNEVNEVNIDVIPTNMNATVEITQVTRTAGIQVGENFFRAIVTSSDKSKSQEYILRVVREKSGNTDLKSLEVVGYDLTPVYSNSENLYVVNVPNEISNIEIRAELFEEVQKITGLGKYDLEVGSNVFEVIVTAENGITRPIKITVNRGYSDDASINNVGVRGYSLSYVEGNIYKVVVPYNVESAEIINISETGATVNGIGLKEGLIVGKNDYEVEVISQSGLVRNNYIIRIEREEDSNNALKSLVVTNYQLTPDFDKEVLLYNVVVENDIESVEVIAEAESSGATVKIDGGKNLVVGDNKVRVIVTAQNKSERTYEITVTRKASSDATLKSLSVEGYTLSPDFSKDITKYQIIVPYNVENVEVIAEATSNTASVEILGNTNLDLGENLVNVKVIAEDKKTIKTYTITVTREKDTDNTLKSLSLTNCTLSPTFNSEILTYSCTVENNITSTVVSAETNSSNAIVTGLGNNELKLGKNTIDIKVSSQSGIVRIYQVKVTRKASSDATLKSLSVEDHEISPKFESDKTEYSVSVPYSVTSVEVVVEVNNSEASFVVEGNTLLKIGENTISVVVTAGDGTKKIYEITVIREQDNDNTLKSLSLTDCILSPEFSSEITAYSCTVENNITSTVVSAKANSSNAIVSGLGSFDLKVGKNTINVSVTSQSGKIKTYGVVVTRKASSDATLKSLTTSSGILTPDFDPYTINYRVSVPYSVESITLTPTVNNSEASFEIIGNTSLEVGENTISIEVTAGDGTKKIYTITVTREQDNDNALKSLSLTDCVLSPAFNSEILRYSCTVANSVTSTTVKAQATSSVASVIGEGTINLDVGTNTINVEVTAQNGNKRIYEVTVTRKASSDANLKSLRLSNGELTPIFASGTTKYAATVSYSVESVEVIAEVNNSEASFVVEGNTLLKIGTNNISVVVTAGDGTKKTYEITVTREQDNDNTLKSLSLTDCILSPEFSSEITAYTCTVENSITSTVVNAEANSRNAIVSGLGSFDLKVGKNTINVSVTSQSGKIKTYGVVVTRKASSDANLKSLRLSNGELTPKFASGTTKYAATVSYSVESVEVIAEVNNSEASFEILGDTNLEVGENTISIEVTAGDGTKKIYTMTVTREQDNDNALKSLSLTDCVLSPAFNSEILRYSCTVANSITSTTVKAQATSSVASVIGEGTINLDVGTNTINVEVTAQNGNKRIYEVIVTRLPNSDASLKALGITGQAIIPTFDKETLVYSLSVPYSVDSIIITGTASQSVSSVEGLGSKTLKVGDNKFNVEVTAEDKTTTRTYTIIVTRKEDTDTSLKSISVTGYNIVKVDNNHYALTVGNNVTNVTVNAEAKSSVAVVTGTGNKSLNVGSNVVKVTVTAQSGAIGVYEINITRQASSDASLKNLALSTGTLSPAFSSNTISYSVSVPYSVESITLTPTVNHSKATYKMTGSTDLKVGANTMTITVTAEDKTTTKIYTITVNRQQDTINTLKSLNLTNCTLSPTFASGTTAYSCTVANSVTSTTVSAQATSNVATVIGTGSKSLSVGNNTITVTGKAQNGSTKDYVIKVKRMGVDTVSLTAKTATYTGSAILANTASATSGTSITYTYYSTTDCSGTALSGAPTNVGNYSVKAVSKGNSDYEPGSICVTHTITKKADTVSLSAKSTTYTGSAISANTASATSGTKITFTYYSTTDCSGTALSGAPTNVGNYSVKATSAGNTNYSAGSKCVTHTITKGTPTISLSSKTATYSGSAISANTATAKNPNGNSVTLSYTYTYYNGTSCSGTALSGAPTTAGSYSVKATSTATTNLNSASSSCVTHTINKKADTVSLSAKSTTYTGSAISANTASATSGTSITYTYYSTTDCSGTALSGAPTNVGNYSVKATSAGNTNYSVGSKCVTHTITKGTPTISLSSKTATYSGSAISANTATAKNPNGNSVTLSYTYKYYNGTSCSGTALSGAPTTAGSYSVKATSTATTNLNSASSSCTKHTINKKADTVSLTAKSTNYTGSAIAANTATSTSGSQITYTFYNGTSCSGTALSGAPTTVGSYSVKATSAGNTNYSSGSTCVTHTITKGTPTISLSPKTVEATGSAITANTPTAKNPNGTSVTLSYSYLYYNGTSCSGTALSSAPSAVGDYSVKAVSIATANLNSASSSCVTHTIKNNTNNNLSSLKVEGYSLSPSFDPSIQSYTLTVSKVEEISVNVTATAQSSLSTVTGTGNRGLNFGTNTLTINVTSQSNEAKPYIITIVNQQPTAPTITGGSDSWVNSAKINVSTAGTAVSGVKEYEYYKSTSNASPSNFGLSSGAANGGTRATGTTSGSLDISDNGTNYIWYRTVSNNGIRSNWTGPQVVKFDNIPPSAVVVTYNSGSNTCSWKDNYDLTLSASDNISGIRDYQIDAFSDGVPDRNISSNFIPENGYSSCTNRFRAVDKAGNEGPWSTDVHHIHMDTEDPTIPTVVFSGFTANRSNLDYTFSVGSSDVISGISRYIYSIDNGSAFATAVNNSVTVSLVKGATHRLVVGAVDNARNSSYLNPETDNFNLITAKRVFIGQLYQGILGRMPDLEGLNFWDNTHEYGYNLIRGVFFSEEAQRILTTPELQAEALYKGVLGRTPSASEISAAATAIRNIGIDQHIKNVNNSQEFIDICNAWGIAHSTVQ